MKRKHQRLAFVAAGIVVLAIATWLVIMSLGDSLNFFYSPSDLEQAETRPEGGFRMGGLVVEESLEIDAGMVAHFAISDGAATIEVAYDQQAHGLLPDLFREGQGVIVEGILVAGGLDAQPARLQVEATRVLAKHDENYMPPEVVDALKRSGEWHGDGANADGAYGAAYGTEAEAE